ncbi:ORF6N domain-containing protein [Variovorax sp. dw_954]|uniref:ORF6N domain-containing protein n=1 Tax=Variovorax sp. dw_954 TaxID=2720078 RepID=UPI001BD54954|nr:ORF6N domain-containing protein [Variovorax sp. dw_954]
MTTTTSNALLPRIEGRIQILRGIKVMIDADLAEFYGVPTKALNQAVKRNPTRFPSDFMFQLTAAEKAEVVSNCDHLAKLKFSRTLPYAFTEHGAIQAANVLASPQAVEMGIYVVRVFVQLRQASALHSDLAKRLTDLEEKVERLEMRHDNFAENTRTQLRQIFDVLRELTMPPDPPKRPIGFVTPEEKKPSRAKSPRK